MIGSIGNKDMVKLNNIVYRPGGGGGGFALIYWSNF